MVVRNFIQFAAVLIIGLIPQYLPAQAKPDFSNYEYHVTEDGAFGLYNPKGWKDPAISQRKDGVFADQKTSYVSMLFLEKIDPKHNSVTFAAATLKNLTQQIPDLKVLESRSARTGCGRS